MHLDISHTDIRSSSTEVKYCTIAFELCGREYPTPTEHPSFVRGSLSAASSAPVRVRPPPLIYTLNVTIYGHRVPRAALKDIRQRGVHVRHLNYSGSEVSQRRLVHQNIDS
ncbi:hypothetical protein EVAR_69169_1 [Eumeta japonica]|uniref:Uncharacterized protein n=1 Tax=Eumeta variegata TaxID=151549 RepID=A0A4C1ZCJ1_EUMVA|nr:hypothetical protein EVAR_69169_1 [Eumeta japonica]